MVDLYGNRIDALEAAERRLCFGRLDLTDGGHLYIGRTGLTDGENRIQIDWRAPAASPYYQASARNPLGLQRRRHISTTGRRVTGVHDDVFDFDSIDEDQLTGDSRLFAALNRERTGRMGEIVETIQAEQDRIVRSEHRGILVVEGGPGTGKTVVALHRAAYLLYRDRAKLERSGVLVVGPSGRFLDYIDEVLPALGETGVVLATISELYPGVDATISDPDDVAALKGDLRMAAVIRNAVANIRRRPNRGLALSFGKHTVKITSKMIDNATRKAFSEDEEHNVARTRFLSTLIEQAITQLAELRELDPSDEYERSDLDEEIRESAQAKRELNLLWMPSTAEHLVRTLFSDPEKLAVAARGVLTPAEQRLLLRRLPIWSEQDIALLDEAAELLGEIDLPGESRRHLQEMELATESARSAGYTAAAAEAILDRYHGTRDAGSIADRALADRSWAYGHVIVDEAQELTPMAWRMLLRRVPSKSMTVVGDPFQTSTPGAPGSWAAALDPVAPRRWMVETLTVNYRTPGKIMDVAHDVMSGSGHEMSTTAVREGEFEPVVTQLPDTAAVITAALEEFTGVSGLKAIIAPKQLLAKLRAAAGISASGATVKDPLVIDAQQSKGLEFDNVVVVEPALIVEETGLASLYVSLTRPTQRLSVLYTTNLPKGL